MYDEAAADEALSIDEGPAWDPVLAPYWDEIELAHQLELLEPALATLEEDDRRIVEQWAHGATHLEIANQLGVTRQSVTERLQRIHRDLGKAMVLQVPARTRAGQRMLATTFSDALARDDSLTDSERALLELTLANLQRNLASPPS